MKFNIFNGVALAILLTLGGAVHADGVQNNGKVVPKMETKGRKLTSRDEFKGAKLDTARWIDS